MHAESGVNGVAAPIGAPTWPPCVAVSAGNAQVSGAHEPGALGSQPMWGPPQASTVPPPVTRQPKSARTASLVPNTSTSARMARTTPCLGERIRHQNGRVRVSPSLLISAPLAMRSVFGRLCQHVERAHDGPIRPIVDPRLTAGMSHPPSTRPWRNATKERSSSSQEAGGGDALLSTVDSFAGAFAATPLFAVQPRTSRRVSPLRPPLARPERHRQRPPPSVPSHHFL